MNITSYFDALPRELYEIIWKNVIKTNKIKSSNYHIWNEFLNEDLIDYIYKSTVINQIKEFQALGIAHFITVKTFCDRHEKIGLYRININNFVIPIYMSSSAFNRSLVTSNDYLPIIEDIFNYSYDYLYILYSLVFNKKQCPATLKPCDQAIKFYDEELKYNIYRTDNFSYIINPKIVKTKLHLFNLFRIMFIYRNTA